MHLLYVLSYLSLVQPGLVSSLNCGNSLTFCKTYSELCNIVVDDLLDGYLTGLPWTAVISVDQGVLNGNVFNTTKQCMAILVSEQDLLVATDCFDPVSSINSTANTTTTIHLANSSYPLSKSNATQLNGVVLISLATAIDNSSSLTNKSVPHSCVPATQYVDIRGAVCGFLRNSHKRSHLSYTCRRVKFAASSLPNSSEQKLWKDFQPGAAVFDHSNDVWSLAAFTTLQQLTLINLFCIYDSLYRLPDNCDLLKAESEGRVECTSIPRGENIVDNWGNSISNPRTLPTVLYGQSGLIPLAVLGLIIILGVVLIAHCLVTGRQRSTYSNI
uniref:Uncharacterized protein n=1 Tax=Ditylenchus dipsaci TaxID=166011 RepID=A0A915DNH8_9BILA